MEGGLHRLIGTASAIREARAQNVRDAESAQAEVRVEGVCGLGARVQVVVREGAWASQTTGAAMPQMAFGSAMGVGGGHSAMSVADRGDRPRNGQSLGDAVRSMAQVSGREAETGAPRAKAMQDRGLRCLQSHLHSQIE